MHTSSCLIFVHPKEDKKHEKLFEFVEFKCQIAQDLVVPWRCVNKKVSPEKPYCLHSDNQQKEPLPNKLYLPQPLPKATPKKWTADEDVVADNNSHPSPKRKMLPVHKLMGTNLHTHMLISNLIKQQHASSVGFAKLRKGPFTGLLNVKKEYCVDCFTAYHCAGALQGQPKMWAEMIIKSECGPDGLLSAHNRSCQHVGTIADLVLHETPIVNTNDVITAVPAKQLTNFYKISYVETWVWLQY
jgi:hypothetical protein